MTYGLTAGWSQELTLYYCKKFGFDDIMVVPAGSNPWDALDQYGKINVTYKGQKKHIQISDAFATKGFDGMETLFQYIKDSWDDLDAYWKIVPKAELEFEERKRYWLTYFG